MTDHRIHKHPILAAVPREKINFRWHGQGLTGYSGDIIASALIANGIHIFGYHHKDHSPQGIFCANGQCSQCMVLSNNHPVKACMELLKPDMVIEPLKDLPELPPINKTFSMAPIKEIDVPVLIIGCGPAGLSAAIELGKHGIQTLMADDKHRLGGKLVLQTHRFFGSVDEVYAGTRGIDIATQLEGDVRNYKSIQIWLRSTALAVYSDQKVGILREGNEYVLVKPKVILVATGAREKFLAFKGNTLPGIFGAGAFQTLVNRDLIKPAEKLFIIGGGNVGLITGYHALQAGISVVGLVEALPECGGYKVHKDKLIRFGVPIYTSHTILSANGIDHVSSITISRVGKNFTPIPGTERSFNCDSILVAVGLDPVNEFYIKAKEYNMPAFAAGDAEEIAEASAAMISGKIKGAEIVRFLGDENEEIPSEWYRTREILSSKPGKIYNEKGTHPDSGVMPIIHCTQEIPCDPCSALCRLGLIIINENDIRQVPRFIGDNNSCKLCKRCLIGCPGLAITLVDSRTDSEHPFVLIPYEYNKELVQSSHLVTVVDTEGNSIGDLKVLDIITAPNSNKTLIVKVQATKEIATKIAGIRIQNQVLTDPLQQFISHVEDDTIICRCEHVTASEIRGMIRRGVRDINEIKAVLRAGMGACGAKTCNSLILSLFREEGIRADDITNLTKRPLCIEVPLGVLAGINNQENDQ